jgi:hypothetical protein
MALALRLYSRYIPISTDIHHPQERIAYGQDQQEPVGKAPEKV